MSEVRGEKRKTVVFNLDNAADRKLFDYVSAPGTNFSKKVKTLLAEEMDAKNPSEEPTG